MSGRYPTSRGSLNTNNSNSAQRVTALLPGKFAGSRNLYDRYSKRPTHLTLNKSKEAQTSGQSSRPSPPAYQTLQPPVIVDLGGSGSIPASPSGRSKPRSRPSSPSLGRSWSVDKLKDPTSTTHKDIFSTREGQKSYEGSQNTDSSRERYDLAPGASPAFTNELTVTEKQASERGKSPRLKRSQSFSLDHSISPNSEQKAQQLLLTKRHGAASKTHSRPMFPTTISPTCTTEPSTASRTNRPAYDSGSRTSLEPAYDVNRSSHSHVPSSPRPRSRCRTTSPSGGRTRPVIYSPAPPHTSALGQSLKSRNTSTGSLPVGTVPHKPHGLGNTSPTVGATVTSPPHPIRSPLGNTSTGSTSSSTKDPYSHISASTHSTGETSTASYTRGPSSHRSQPSLDEDYTHRSTNSTPGSTPSSSARHRDLETFPECGGRVGLGNLGNTCFMNSMLQCLGQTGEMARIFLEMEKPHNKSLVKAYQELMKQMWSGNKTSSTSSLVLSGSIYPRDLKDAFSRMNPQFSGFNQHDSQEFMRFLVSGLHEELKKESRDKPITPQEPDPEQWWTWYRELEKSRLMDVFVGQLRSSLTCGTCGHCSVTFDPFWELSVSLPSRRSFSTTYSSSHGHGVGYPTGSSSGTRLEDCLKIFTEDERLDGDEQPYCEKCRRQEPGVKKMTIQRLPPVLVIHLKRFSSYGRRSKLDTSVTIPHTLNVSDYTTREPSRDVSDKQYELYGVSNHSGTVYFGHYTAWCKHYSSNKWFSYNDSQVSPLTVQTPTISSSTAYVLFYRRSGKLTTRC